MTWSAAVDGYCERLSPAFWAEPWNAATNAAFLLAALVMALRLRGAHLPLANLMVTTLTAIGLGSFLFHTFATRWAGLADTLPILLFILVYLYAASRDMLGMSSRMAMLGTLAFFPFAALTVPLFALVPGLGSSAGYAPVPLLLVGYGLALRRRAPAAARGLGLAAALLIVSLTARTLDEPLCSSLPRGTHFIWHILNAALLGGLIETYRRHMLAGAARGR